MSARGGIIRDVDKDVLRYAEAKMNAATGEIRRLLRQCERRRGPDKEEEIRRQFRLAKAAFDVARAETNLARERYFAALNRPRKFREGGRPKDADDGRSDYEGDKTKSGRPSLWLSLEGYFLVKTVEEIRARNKHYSLARAIRKAIKVHPILKDNKAVHRPTDRALQARYQQAADFWADALERDLERDLDRAAEIEQMARGYAEILLAELDTL